MDKTLMIKEFLDERPQVALFTRPRRFGKTLNMDMLRTFFEKTNEDTSVYFRDKAIWKQGEKYQAYQGKYPVIFLSFKDVKCETWHETLQKLAEIIGSEFARHEELLTAEACNDVDKATFRRIMERAASDNRSMVRRELYRLLAWITKLCRHSYVVDSSNLTKSATTTSSGGLQIAL